MSDDDVCCWAIIFIGAIFYISYVMDQRSGQKLENTNTNYNTLTKDTNWSQPRASNFTDKLDKDALGGNIELQYAPTTDTITDFMDELDENVKKAKNKKTSNKNTIPLEWKQLKEIYPEAEMKEYSDYNNFMNGNWDKEGLREDLELMIKRTGKTPKGSYSDDEDWRIINEKTDFNKLTIYKLRDELKAIGLSASGNKKTLIKRLNTALEEKKKERKKDETPEIANNDEEMEGEVVALLEPVGKKIKKRKSHKTKMEEIKELGEMMNNGLITQEEFEGLKKDIMKDEE